MGENGNHKFGREREIFFAALERKTEESRTIYLGEACGDDKAMLERVREMLEHHSSDDTDTFLTNPGIPQTGILLEREGSMVGNYRLEKKLGEGGFGVVWMAQQEEPVKRKVALKLIKPGMDSAEVIARFGAERQALAVMDHPNIAKVFDAGATDSGRPYFVMELADGVPITEFCDREKLHTKARLELFAKVCGAVQHAHQKAVIHRDLKPSNILVVDGDDGPVPKVIDFGIAKAIGEEAGAQTAFTAHGQLVGTPQYMSPEQAGMGASADIDTRSDVYSLGVVLYELLAGSPPFDVETLRSAGFEGMCRIIREEDPPKPSTKIGTMDEGSRTEVATVRQATPHQLGRQLHGDLDWVVMRSLEKDRARRYGSAGELAEDIGRHLRQEPVAAGPPSARYRIGKFVRRNRGRLIGGAAATVALLAGLAVAGIVWVDASVERRDREAAVERRAETLLEEAERHMAKNAAVDFEDDSNFRQAVELAGRLKSMLGIEAAGEEVLARRDALLAAVETEGRARKLIVGIEEALMAEMSDFGSGGDKSQSIAGAFEAFGINPVELSVDEMVAVAGNWRRSLLDRILVGLVEWKGSLEKTEPEKAARLGAVIDQCDSDPWRRFMRNAADAHDVAALRVLAESPELSQQPTMTILELFHAFGAEQLADESERLLRRAQREDPTGFWTNFWLGVTLTGKIGRKEGSDIRHFMVANVDLGSTFLPGSSRKSIIAGSEYDEGIGFLRVAVAARPDAGVAWATLGGVLSSGGHPKEAITSFQRSVELNPEEASVHSILSMILLHQKRYEEAIASAKHALELDPEDQSPNFNQGIALANLGKYEEARACLAQAGEFGADQTSPFSFLGIIQLNRGDLEEAIDSFQEAIEANAEDSQGHGMLGFAFTQQGAAAAATLSYRRAIELDPNLAMAHNGLGLISMAGRDFESALSSFRLVTKLEPEDPQAWSNLGISHFELDEVDEAVAALRKAIDIDPEFSMALTNLGLAIGRQGDLEEAISYHRKAVAADSEYTNAHGNLAKALWKSGELEEAIKHYRRLTVLIPEDAKAHADLGEALAEIGKLDEAMEVCQKALKLDPKSAVAHNGIGYVLAKRDKFVEAEKIYRKAIAFDPKFATGHNNLGFALMQQGKLEDGIASCRRAIALDPKLSLAYANLTAGLMAQSEFDEALEVGRKAVELDPELAMAHGNLGGVLLGLGKFDEAAVACRRAIDLDPKLATAHGVLGGALARLGKLDDAVKSYKQAIELEPEYPLVKAYLSHFNLESFGDASLEMLEEVLELSRKVHGEEHPDILVVLTPLVSIYGESGRIEKAVEVGEKALSLNRQLNGVEDPETISAMNVLASAYCAAGRFDEAIAMGEEVVTRSRRVNGPEHEETLGGMTNLAGHYDDAGRLDEAFNLQEKALSIKRRVLPEDHPYLVIAISRMAGYLEKKDRPDEALKLAAEALSIRRKTLGADHADTLMSQGNLSGLLYKSQRFEELAFAVAEHGEHLRLAGHGQDSELQTRVRAELEELSERVAKRPIPEDAIARHYAANKEAFRGIVVRLHMITIKRDADPKAGGKQRKKAKDLLDTIAGGKPFAEVAREHSEDAWKEDGGDRGVVERGTFGLELDNAIFAMEPGTTKLHESTKFFWILQVEDRKAGEDIAPLEEVRTEIEDILRERMSDDLVRKWQEEARKKVGPEGTSDTTSATD